jgi:hypothetical protein
MDFFLNPVYCYNRIICRLIKNILTLPAYIPIIF